MTEPLCVSRIGLHCLHCPNTQSCKNFKETLALPSRIVSVDFLQLLKPFLLCAAENARRIIALDKAKKWSANLKGKMAALHVLRRDRRRRRQVGLCRQRNSLGERGA